LQDLARRRGVATDVEAVVVTQVDSDGLAANERVRRGMIILQVNDQEVRTVREFNAALRNESLSKGVLILVHDPQTEGSRFVLFKN
jgi:S1-C subfamily serine protease